MGKFVGYTVKDWKRKFYPDGNHYVLNDFGKVPDDVVVCDVCNKEIRQDSDKKVVWHYEGGYEEGNWALCSDCKDDPKKFENSKKIMQEYKSLTGYSKNPDSLFVKMVADAVFDDILEGLRNGTYFFQDKDMTYDKYVLLSNDDKEKYPVGIRNHDGFKSTNVLAITSRIMNGDVVDALIKNVSLRDDGVVDVELTDIGARFHRISTVKYGFDFSSFLSIHLSKALKKEIFNYVFLTSKIEKGNRRVESFK